VAKMYPDYNNPPYGTPAYFEKMDRLKNAHKSPDGILAQQQIQATQDAYAAANPVLNTNPLPTTDIPPGTQVNPRQGPTPGQRFMDGAKGILGQLAGSQSGQQQSPVEVATQQAAAPQQAAPTHTMPDGTVMPGATHVPAPVREGVGMAPMTDQERAAFAMTPAGQRLAAAQEVTGDPEAQTGGRRDSTALAAAKQNSGMSFAEKMGRYGGAIMNAGSQGGMAQVGAMGTVTGEIKDIEREQENLRLQEQQKVQKEQQKKSAEFDEIIGTYDSSIAEMDRLYADVFAAGDELTGPYDGFMGKWIDNLRGNPEAYTRLAMDQFKVDEILKNVAKTKGAISDREMETFERPMPSMSADEDVWLDWIYKKREAAISVRKKLRAMQGGGSASNYSPEDQALVDQYSQ
jgi:hypothetical protein